jgi:hypothetical protein
MDLTSVRALKQASDLQEGRFAGTRGSDERHDFPPSEPQLDSAQHLEPSVALAEAPFDARKPQARRAARMSRLWLVLRKAQGWVHS